jgi:hypothetical protein
MRRIFSKASKIISYLLYMRKVINSKYIVPKVGQNSAVRQARVRISARHPKEVPPTEPTAMKI